MKVDAGTATVATAGTAVQVSNTKRPDVSIVFTARVDNTGFIYIGVSDVASTKGMELDAGDSLPLTFGDADPKTGSVPISTFWADSSVNGEKVDWVAIIR